MSQIRTNSIVPAGGIPAGATGGGIIQVVQATKTDTFSTSSQGSWIDVTGWTASITPRSTSSKILVNAIGTLGLAGGNDFAYVKLLRGSTDIYLGDSRGSATRCSADGARGGYGSDVVSKPIFIEFVDSPATTSSTTYKIQVNMTYGSGVLIGGTWSTNDGNRSNTPTTMILMEVSG